MQHWHTTMTLQSFCTSLKSYQIWHFLRGSDLINISFADTVDHLEGGGISLYNPAAHEELNDEGFIFITRIQS